MSDDLKLDPRYVFKSNIERCKVLARDAVERVELMAASAREWEQKIHSDILNNKILPELGKSREILYTAILSYNAGTVRMYHDEDILKGQLMLDEVAAMLEKVGIHTTYSRKD